MCPVVVPNVIIPPHPPTHPLPIPYPPCGCAETNDEVRERWVMARWVRDEMVMIIDGHNVSSSCTERHYPPHPPTQPTHPRPPPYHTLHAYVRERMMKCVTMNAWWNGDDHQKSANCSPPLMRTWAKTRSSLWYFFSAFCHCLRQNSWCFHKEWGPYQIWCGSTWNCTSRRRTGCLEMGGRGRGYASLGMLMPNSEAISSTRTNNHGLCCVCIVPRIPVFLPYSAVFWSVAFLLLSSSRIFPDFL